MGERSASRRRPGGPVTVVRLVTMALAGFAIVQELRKDPAEREWNGRVAGFVPYDFRFPTLARVKERVWDPDGDHWVGPRVFGVGWTVNVGRVVAVLRARLEGEGVPRP